MLRRLFIFTRLFLSTTHLHLLPQLLLLLVLAEVDVSKQSSGLRTSASILPPDDSNAATSSITTTAITEEAEDEAESYGGVEADDGHASTRSSSVPTPPPLHIPFSELTKQNLLGQPCMAEAEPLRAVYNDSHSSQSNYSAGRKGVDEPARVVPGEENLLENAPQSSKTSPSSSSLFLECTPLSEEERREFSMEERYLGVWHLRSCPEESPHFDLLRQRCAAAVIHQAQASSTPMTGENWLRLDLFEECENAKNIERGGTAAAAAEKLSNERGGGEKRRRRKRRTRRKPRMSDLREESNECNYLTCPMATTTTTTTTTPAAIDVGEAKELQDSHASIEHEGSSSVLQFRVGQPCSWLLDLGPQPHPTKRGTRHFIYCRRRSSPLFPNGSTPADGGKEEHAFFNPANEAACGTWVEEACPLSTLFDAPSQLCVYAQGGGDGLSRQTSTPSSGNLADDAVGSAREQLRLRQFHDEGVVDGGDDASAGIATSGWLARSLDGGGMAHPQCPPAAVAVSRCARGDGGANKEEEEERGDNLFDEAGRNDSGGIRTRRQCPGRAFCYGPARTCCFGNYLRVELLIPIAAPSVPNPLVPLPLAAMPLPIPPPPRIPYQQQLHPAGYIFGGDLLQRRRCIPPPYSPQLPLHIAPRLDLPPPPPHLPACPHNHYYGAGLLPSQLLPVGQRCCPRGYYVHYGGSSGGGNLYHYCCPYSTTTTAAVKLLRDYYAATALLPHTPRYCPTGIPAKGYCSAYHMYRLPAVPKRCPRDTYCMEGLCCPPPICPSTGREASILCKQQPSVSQKSRLMETKLTDKGPHDGPTSDGCLPGYECLRGGCCPLPRCHATGGLPYGRCSSSSSVSAPNTTAQCPGGSACTAEGLCCALPVCSGNRLPAVGFCSANTAASSGVNDNTSNRQKEGELLSATACPTGYECQNGGCCPAASSPTFSSTSELSSKAQLIFAPQPTSTYYPLQGQQSVRQQCPSGWYAVSRCSMPDRQCPQRSQCHWGHLCCAPYRWFPTSKVAPPIKEDVGEIAEKSLDYEPLPFHSPIYISPPRCLRNAECAEVNYAQCIRGTCICVNGGRSNGRRCVGGPHHSTTTTARTSSPTLRALRDEPRGVASGRNWATPTQWADTTKKEKDYEAGGSRAIEEKIKKGEEEMAEDGRRRCVERLSAEDMRRVDFQVYDPDASCMPNERCVEDRCLRYY